MVKRLVIISALVCIALVSQAQTAADSVMLTKFKHYNDSAIYMGTNIHLDLFMSILEAARSKGALQTYEVGVNVRLKQRFFPCVEGGYAFGAISRNGCQYQGRGGFARIGLDINGLKKHPADPNALLIGIRFAGSYQDYSVAQTCLLDPIWGPKLQPQLPDFSRLHHWDAWGEIVGGCQVRVVSNLTMGWYIRLKVLATRQIQEGSILPFYIPGYGYRRDTNWGITYNIGWTL